MRRANMQWGRCESWAETLIVPMIRDLAAQIEIEQIEPVRRMLLKRCLQIGLSSRPISAVAICVCCISRELHHDCCRLRVLVVALRRLDLADDASDLVKGRKRQIGTEISTHVRKHRFDSNRNGVEVSQNKEHEDISLARGQERHWNPEEPFSQCVKLAKLLVGRLRWCSCLESLDVSLQLVDPFVLLFAVRQERLEPYK